MKNLIKKMFCVLLVLVFIACNPDKSIKEVPVSVKATNSNVILNENDDSFHLNKFVKTITAKDLKKRLSTYSSAMFMKKVKRGYGQNKNARYLRKFYLNKDIKSPWDDENYFQKIPLDFLTQGIWGKERHKILGDSKNVVAFIRGRDRDKDRDKDKDNGKVVIISAHLNSLSVINGKIFNRADDNGSGTVAILEIAEAFKEALKAGKRPKRSVLFLHLSSEREGLSGSKYYVQHPIFPLKNTIANLDIDMIGNVDSKHKAKPNYLYLSILDKKSSRKLYQVSEKMNQKFTNIDLDYEYSNKSYPSKFYSRHSDYNFTKNKIPVISYFGGLHEENYNAATDTHNNINYELLEKRTRLIFCTAWAIANKFSVK